MVELAQGAGQFARSVATLGTAEEHTSLARALSQLSEVAEKVESVHQAQSDADFYILSELIHDYVSMVHAVKVIHYRAVQVKIKMFALTVHTRLYKVKSEDTYYRVCIHLS